MVTSSLRACWIRWALALVFFPFLIGSDAFGAPGAGNLETFDSAPSFTVTGPVDELVVPVNLLHRGEKIVLHPTGGGALGTVAVTSDTAWVRGLPSENRIGDVDLLIDTNGVAEGEYPVKLTITAGSTTQQFDLKIDAWIPFVKRFIADPGRPRVYALATSQYDDRGEYARIIVTDVVSGKAVRDLDGTGIYDIALSSDESTLYGLVYDTNEVVRFDLERMVRIPTGVRLPLARGDFQFQPAVQLIPGPGPVLYFLGRTSSALIAFDTSTGQTLQTISQPGPGLFFQSLARSPDGKTLIADQVAPEGYQGPAVAPFIYFDVAADGTLIRRGGEETPLVVPSFRYGQYLPLGFRSDGKKIAYGDHLFETGKSFGDSTQINQKVMGMSPGGEFLTGEYSLISGDGDRILGTSGSLYTHSPMLVTPEGKIFYSGYKLGLAVYDPRAEIGDAAAGFQVSPADQSHVAAPAVFRCLPVPGAREYRLYVSRNAGDLAVDKPAATFLVSKSRLYLLPNETAMAAGETWSWRIDAVSPDGIVAGAVRSFTVGAIYAGGDKVDLTVPKSCRAQPLDLPLSSAASQTWTATSSASWLTLTNESGTSPGVLHTVINTTLMPALDAAATVTIVAGDSSTVVPVRVRQKEMDGEVAVFSPAFATAQDKQTAFALLHTHEQQYDGGPDFLVRINPETGAFIESRRVGFGAGYLRLSPDQSQIAVETDAYNSYLGKVIVFDVDSLRQVTTVAGATRWDASAPGIALGPDGLLMFHDRLVHWPDMQVRGILPNSLPPVYSAFSPDGKSLYGMTDTLTKLDTTDPGLRVMKSVKLSDYPNYYNAGIFCSKNGSIIAGGNVAFDADLNILGHSDHVITALNRNGTLAYSSDGLLNVPDLKVIGAFPYVQFPAFYDPGDVLLALSPAIDGVPGFSRFSYKDLVHIDPAALVPGIADGGLVASDRITLTWSEVLKAGRYHVFLGTNRSEIEQAAIGDPSELGSTTGTSWSNAVVAAPGTIYFWKIIMDGVDAQVPSAVWSFHASSFSVNVEKVSLMSARGGLVVNQAVQITLPEGISWSSNSTTPWLDAGKSGTGSGSFNVSADPYGLAAGDYTGAVTVTVGAESVSIPVTLKVFTYHVLTILADAGHGEAHLVIGLGSAAKEGEENYLARLDMAKHQITELIDLGPRPQYGNDYRLVLHPEDDRIYVIDPQSSSTRRYDRTRYALDSSLDLTVITNTAEGPFFYAAVSAGPGKIAVPFSSPFATSIAIFSTVNGARLSSVGLDVGGGLPGLISAPGGKRIYCNRFSNTTRPAIYYDISDAGAITQSTVTGQTGGPSIPGFALSADGSVLLWNGGYYRADLSYLGSGPALLAQKAAMNLSGTGKFIYLADTYVVTRDGSNVYLPEPGGFTSGTLVCTDGLSNQYLAKDMESSLTWISPLEPETSGLPAIPGSGFLSYGGQGWKPDLSQSGTVVCRNPRNLECAQFSNYSVLGIQFPAAGTLSFQWRRIATGSESLTFRSRSTSYTAPSNSAWETHTLAITAGSYASWSFSGDRTSLSASASAEIRNVTFTPAVTQSAQAVSPGSGLDSDHDGFADLVERALGTDAALAASRPSVSLHMDGGLPALVYEHPVNSAYHCTVQVSTDLMTWEDLPETGTLRTSGVSGIEQVSVPLPAGRAQLFTRLKVDAPAE